MSESKNYWIEDNESNREYHGKTVLIFKDEKRLGVFLMHVTELDDEGIANPGFVRILAEPFDEEAISNMGAGPKRFDGRNLRL